MDSLWSILGNSTFGKMYTLNFDGSHNNQANQSGAGCVIRDSKGELFVAASYNLTETHPENCNVAIVEAVALLNGLKLAKDHNLNLNLIKGDSKEVIDHVLDRTRRPSRPPLSGIIQQIVGMIDRSSQKIEIINREANQVADKLASWGCNRLQPGGRIFYTTYSELPPQVAELIRQEKSLSPRTEEGNGEGSSLAGNIVKVAGVAMFAWGMYKMVSGESSSDQDFSGNDYYTLHYSGIDKNQKKIGGAGCIIRNKEGKLVIAATYNLNHLYPDQNNVDQNNVDQNNIDQNNIDQNSIDQYNIAVAEAIAWSNGLKLAETKRLKLVRVIGDNTEVINRVRGLEKKAPKVHLLSETVSEIREALQEHSIDPWTQVERIGREENKVANELASLGSKLCGYKEESYYGPNDVLPSKLDRLIREDEKYFKGKNLRMY